VAKYDMARLIRLENNVGYAAGNNAGFRQARGKYIATLNNDMVVDAAWLDEAILRLEEDSAIGIVSCRQMNYFGKSTIDGLYQVLARHLGFVPFGHNRKMNKNPLYDQPGFVLGANGGSAIYRKELIDQLQGFDERFFAYFEEIDLCLRAFAHGWKCLYVPSAVVYHKAGKRGGASFSKQIDQYYYYRERNRIWFLFKTYPASTLIRHLVFIVLYELRIFRVVAIKNRLPLVYFRSRIHAIVGLHYFFAQRKAIVPLIKERMIELNIFFKRKKIPCFDISRPEP
jgi:hypothetical protein